LSKTIKRATGHIKAWNFLYRSRSHTDSLRGHLEKLCSLIGLMVDTE
jgi:hypothetical protein